MTRSLHVLEPCCCRVVVVKQREEEEHSLLVANSMSPSISNGMQSTSGKRALYTSHAISALVKLIACNRAHVLKCSINIHMHHHSCTSYLCLVYSQTGWCDCRPQGSFTQDSTLCIIKSSLHQCKVTPFPTRTCCPHCMTRKATESSMLVGNLDSNPESQLTD